MIRLLYVGADERDETECGTASSLTCEELYERYATDILRYAYFFLKDLHTAKDVCQAVFYRFLVKKPFIEAGYEKAWLLKVAANLCRDHWRSAWFKHIITGHPILEIIPDTDRIDQYVEKKSLMQAVGNLPAQYREVILLHYYQQLSLDEIAEILSIPQGTVGSRLARARKLLKDSLAEC